MKARPSVAKRQKERARAEKKRVKAMRREERKYTEADAKSALDISHIVPGPQPVDPWDDDEEKPEGEEEKAAGG